MDYQYRDLRPFAGTVRIALIVWIAAVTAYSAVAAWSIMTVEAFEAGTAAMADLERVDSLGQVSALIFVPINLLTIVLVSMWIYRANRNAHALSDAMVMTPGWNIGWFFVPIASLWKPFEGLRQAWQSSVSPGDPDSVEVPGWMRMWWGAWLISSIIANLAFRLSLSAKTLDEIVVTYWLDLASLPFDLVATFTLGLLVQRLSQIQHDTHEAHEAAAG